MYALLLEQGDAQVATERQVAAVLLAAGAKGVEMPTYDQARRQLDSALVAEPVRVNTEQEELLRALGVRP